MQAKGQPQQPLGRGPAGTEHMGSLQGWALGDLGGCSPGQGSLTEVGRGVKELLARVPRVTSRTWSQASWWLLAVWGP